MRAPSRETVHAHAAFRGCRAARSIISSPSFTRVAGSSRSRLPSNRQPSRSNLWVHPRRFAHAAAELPADALRQFTLLPRTESSGDALPQDQPLDLALNVLRKREARRVDFPQLRDSPVVERAPKARTHAETSQIEPSNLEAGPRRRPASTPAECPRACESPLAAMHGGHGRPHSPTRRSSLQGTPPAGEAVANELGGSCQPFLVDNDVIRPTPRRRLKADRRADRPPRRAG